MWEIKSTESMHLVVSAGNDVDNWSVGGSGACEGKVDSMWITFEDSIPDANICYKEGYFNHGFGFGFQQTQQQW